MKYFLLILLFSLQINCILSQTSTYRPLPDSNAVWIYEWQDFNCQPIGYCGDIYYIISGDTLLGGNSYKKIYRAVNNSNYSFVAGIRQDLSAKKVYIAQVNNCSYNDTLLYDFSKQPGDSLYLCNEIIGEPTYITSVDSVVIDGEWRKKINLNTDGSLIEGIGSTSGLLGAWSGWIGGNYSLKCFSVNNISLYPNNSCNTIANIELEQKTTSSKIQIFPSPLTNNGTLIIDLEKTTVMEVKLYDMIGKNKIIFYGTLNNGNNTININTSEFQSGLYRLEIIIKNDNYRINKLVEIIH